MSYKTISALRLSLQEGFLGNWLEYEPNKGTGRQYREMTITMIGRTRRQKWWLWNTSHLWCLHAVTRDEPCLFLFASFSVLPFHAEETVALWDGQVPLVNALGCIRQSAYKARCIKTNYKYMERCLPEMHKTKFIWQGALKEAKIELGGKLAISRVVQRSLFDRSKKWKQLQF